MISGWYIAESFLLAIKVNLELDTSFDYSIPGAIIFYNPDEPIGHSIPFDEIVTKQEAIWALEDLKEYREKFKIDNPQFYEDHRDFYEKNWTLEDWRQLNIDGINKTWEEVAKTIPDYKPITIDDFKPKKEMEEWFNYNHLLKIGDRYTYGKYQVEVTRINVCEGFSTVNYRYVIKPLWMDDKEYGYPMEKFIKDFSKV